MGELESFLSLPHYGDNCDVNPNKEKYHITDILQNYRKDQRAIKPK